jgi:hypothetical protein
MGVLYPWVMHRADLDPDVVAGEARSLTRQSRDLVHDPAADLRIGELATGSQVLWKNHQIWFVGIFAEGARNPSIPVRKMCVPSCCVEAWPTGNGMGLCGPRVW